MIENMQRLVLLFVVAACGGASSQPTISSTRSPTTEAPAAPRDPEAELVESGKQLYTVKGCVACHTVDGSPRVGPSWKGIWDQNTSLDDGRTVHIDADYIRRSIKTPSADTVAGFPKGVMPSFEGQLTDRQIDGVIAYIRSLR
jgi:cytochrome c oxidase subunit II